MSALDSIVEWAEEDLLDWQSDAVRRLLLQEELTPEDKEEILRMIKESHGLKDPKHPAPKLQPLKKGDVSGAPETRVKITLKALKDLKNVNAIPDGSSLPFAHKGLTVIYGENEAAQISVTNDYLVQKAMESLPQARELLSKAKKYMASKSVK